MRDLLHRLRFACLALVLIAPLGFLLASTSLAQDPHTKEPAGHAGKDDAEAKRPDPDDKDHGEKKQEPTAMEHVLDSKDIHLFEAFPPHHIPLPSIFGFQITKFMVLEVIAALLVIVIYIPLGQMVKSGEPARGWFWNAFEVLLTFVREQIAKPTLGDKHADRFVPFLWTMFLFILFNNLLGMVPFLGSATASVFVTGALALIVFFAIHGSAIVVMGSQPAHDHNGHGHDDHGHGDNGHGHEHGGNGAGAAPNLITGLGHYVASYWPHIDLPAWGFPIKFLVFYLEFQGALIRNGVLAIRLFANMFAGHMVLATILLFIQMAANVNVILWGTVTISSVLGIVALSLLELFIAFLQAYIFTFLASLFMGMAMYPQH
jgi:F-type H+-transporting ATPase subunit a